MPLKLPQSYKFKYFFFIKIPNVGGPLLISNPNVDYSSHGIQRASLPLSSPCNFIPSNVDHNDDVMSLDGSNPILEINLHVISFKLIVKKRIMMHLEIFKILGLQNYHRLK